MRGIRTRSMWLAPLLAVTAVTIPASAQAGAGDDAHFLVNQVTANNGTVPTSHVIACPIGEVALGGGVRYSTFPKDIVVRAGGPLSDTGGFLEEGGFPSRFQNLVQNLGTQPRSMSSYAICSASTDAKSVRVIKFTAVKGTGDFPIGRAVATCPTGQRAIGGGVIAENANYGGFVMANGPVDETTQVSSTNDGDVPVGWMGAVRANEGDRFRVYAICSPTSTATVQVESMVMAQNTGGHTGLTCPTGQRALSGGVIDEAAYAWIVSSAPGSATSFASAATPGIAGGWHGSVWSVVGSNVLFKVAAVCESPTAPNAPPPVIDPGDPAPPEPPAVVPDTVSNQFTIGRFYRDKDKGRGAIVLAVPGPGTVTLKSSKLKYQVNVAKEAEDVGLSVLAAEGQPRKKLLRKGKLKAKVKLTFIPDGGSPSVQKDKLKLIYE